jgi:hypothetical protein
MPVGKDAGALVLPTPFQSIRDPDARELPYYPTTD